MVTAAASTARPTIWPPTRRVESGKDADTSLTRMGTAVGAGDGSGVGETCGKATLGSFTGLGSRGSPADENSPGGNPPGSVTPTPGGSRVVPVGVEAAVTVMLAEAEAEAADCDEVPVALRVIWVPAAFCGAVTAACSWMAWPAVRATEHDVPPVAAQTVKPGVSVAGFAVILTLALPFTEPASQTQIT